MGEEAYALARVHDLDRYDEAQRGTALGSARRVPANGLTWGDRLPPTAGPWTVAAGDGGPMTLVRAGDAQTGRRVANTFASQPRSSNRETQLTSLKTNEANARLIAAAPELHAFAKALDDSWTEAMPDGPDGPGYHGIGVIADEHRALWKQCRTALAKAAGQ